MKRFSRLVCLMMTVVFVFMLIPVANAASKITLKSGAAAPATIYAGHTYNLKVAGKKVKFTTSNKKVATIGATTGKMKAVAPGKVKITAKNAKSGKAVAAKTFTVLQRAKSVTADSEVYLGDVGDTTTLKAALTPATSTDVIRFATADKTIATVGATSGKITAKAEGETTVTVYAKATKATANSNKNNKIAQVKIYVGAALDRAYDTAESVIHVDFKTDVSSKKIAPADFVVTNKETSVVEAVKEVHVSGKEVNLLLYNRLIPGKTYTVKYGKFTAEFTAGEGIPEVADIPTQLVLSDPTLSMWTNDDSIEENEEGIEEAKADSAGTTVSVSTTASLLNLYGKTLPTGSDKISLQLIQAPGSSVPKISTAADPSQTGTVRITFTETPDLQQGSYVYQVNCKATAEGKEITLQALLVLNVVNMADSGSEPEMSTVSFYDKEGNDPVLLASYTLEVGSDVPWHNMTKPGMTCVWTWYREDTEERIETPSLVPAYNIYAVAEWAWAKKQYTVTFLDEDERTVLKQAEYDYGTAADIVKPEDPTKAATDEFTYTFAGWNPEIAKVTGDATYTATYNSTVNKYNVTFVDEDGTTLKTATAYDYGTAAADIVKPDDPTKAATDEYTYTFAGWSPEIAKVTGDATYTATYRSIARKYNVTFVDENGTVLSSTTYDYGTAAADIMKPADPKKAATAQYTYSFIGWDPAVANVTGDATYKATYKATSTGAKQQYTVTFVDEDRTTLKTATAYDYGTAAADIVKPADPTKAATDEYTYTFAGWSPEIAKVTGDATYTATYNSTVNKYNVTFVDEDRTTLKTATAYDYGTAAADIVKPADPTKAATDEYTYTFAGWNPEIAKVTGDATYKATYSSTVKKYTVTFVDDDGTTVLKAATTYDYGTAAADIVKPDDPTKAATDEYTYTFAGWNPEVAKVTGDATYKATYNSTVNKYDVTFVDDDGTTVLKAATTYDYGTAAADIVKPADPTKAATDEYTYAFAGWSPDIAKVTGYATYKATYKSAKNSYTITWLNDDDSAIDTTTVEYGKVPTHADASKKVTAEYTYTFKGWTPDVAAVTGDATYKATYTTTKNSYTITWLNDDDSVIDTTTVEHGKVPTHADASKKATSEYTYTFKGWTPDVAAVTGDATYKATYTTTKNSYTITWLNDDDSVIDTTTVEYGKVPTHVDASKAATAEYTYTFKGWTPDVAAVTGDATYKAEFTDKKNSYTITWNDDEGNLIDTTTVEYGKVPTHADVTKAATAEYTYTPGWDPEVVAVTGNATYKAIFTATKNSYTITWNDDEGKLIDTTTVEYGKVPTHADVTKAATAEYTYTPGWDPEVVAVTGNATYKAIFTATKNSYKITWNDDEDKLIDTTTVEYGVVPTHADASKKTTAEYTYMFKEWTPKLVAVTGDATYKAKFTDKKNSYTITWKNEDGSTIDTTTVEYGVVPTHANVTKAATDEYTYTPGWDPEVVAVEGDAEYTAKFTATKNSYTIRWLDDEENLIDTTTVEYGTVPTHAKPTKAATSDSSFTFAGWDPEVVAVTGDADYTATFKQVYTITVYPYYYKGNDEKHCTDSKYTIKLAPGDIIHDPDTPEMIPEYANFMFRGWEWSGASVANGSEMPKCNLIVYGIWVSTSTTTDNSYSSASY